MYLGKFLPVFAYIYNNINVVGVWLKCSKLRKEMGISASPPLLAPLSGGASLRSHSFPQYLLCDHLIFSLYEVRDFLTIVSCLQ